MAIFIDKRKNSKGQSAPNRERFLERNKKYIKKSVDAIANKRKMKDIFEEGSVTISKDDLSEPTFHHDANSGTKTIVMPGNKQHQRGDILERPKGKKGARGGSPDGEGMDDFIFVLSKEEFLELYFSDLELPNYIKEGIKKVITWKRHKAGYSREGIPARLNIKKTFEQAIARRISTKAQGKKPRYLDDIDIRYDYYTKRPEPKKHAVMFCMMDVSGSMGEHEKTLAKKFFLLLYIFLHKEYENVELVFVRHTQEAEEVTEEQFFYDKVTGGTIVSSGFHLISKIIDERYSDDNTNLYIAQASDGDNWDSDLEYCVEKLETLLLPRIQYFAYIQVEEQTNRTAKDYYGVKDLYNAYADLPKVYKNFNCKRVTDASEIYPVFRSLFEKDQK